MLKHTPVLLVAALVTTAALVGTVGRQVRAELAHSECVGKTYGVPGCPLKQQSQTCGNGTVEDGEECDNGAARNGAGNCSNVCMFLACGDGVVSKELGEECEPKREEVYAIDPATGKLTTVLRFMAASCGTVCTAPVCNGDGVCSGGCTREFKQSCVATPSSPSSEASFQSQSQASSSASSREYVPRCGNSVKDPGEQCDDGNTLDTDGCTIACKLPRCGDGAVQRGEQCDDGNAFDNDGCTNKCAKPACGDGIVQEDEQCDTGGNNSDYLANACRNDCTAPRCGDGVIDNGEECDGGESCTNECVRVKTFASLVMDTPWIGKIAIALSVFGAFLVMLFAFRAIVKRFVRHVAGDDAARSIDEIPLDEIEMPWHTWGNRDNK